MEETPKRIQKILCLEDNVLDFELLRTSLTESGLTCEFTHVTNQSDYERALHTAKFDLIISDYSLPSYNGLAALAAAQKAQSETPFVFLSGTIGEERAVESLRRGATDYVVKDRPDRLVSALHRALWEARAKVERKQLEEQLRQSQKMEAIGKLSAGVSHDFNNLLAVISGNAELLHSKLADNDPDSLGFLNQISGACERAANLTRQLLAFGRNHPMRLEPMDLNDAVAEMVKLLRRITGEDIAFVCSLDAKPSYVTADLSMVEQVLLNLVVNARDAMPSGGRLELSTSIVCSNEKDFEGQPSRYVCLGVADTGTGIAPEILPHIFTPYFTTKEVGKGTGIGLTTVFGIMKQHSGWIEVTSNPGSGSSFRAYFPAVQDPGLKGKTIQCRDISRSDGEIILLVEDESSVRLLTRKMLEAHGYVVIEAESGRAALDLLHASTFMPDLLLTDQVMPDGVTGRDLVDQLRVRQPSLKVVFMSGYNYRSTSKDTDFFSRGDTFFLQKPFSTQALLQSVQQCLLGR